MEFIEDGSSSNRAGGALPTLLKPIYQAAPPRYLQFQERPWPYIRIALSLRESRSGFSFRGVVSVPQSISSILPGSQSHNQSTRHSETCCCTAHLCGGDGRPPIDLAQRMHRWPGRSSTCSRTSRIGTSFNPMPLRVTSSYPLFSNGDIISTLRKCGCCSNSSWRRQRCPIRRLRGIRGRCLNSFCKRFMYEATRRLRRRWWVCSRRRQVGIVSIWRGGSCFAQQVDGERVVDSFSDSPHGASTMYICTNYRHACILGYTGSMHPSNTKSCADCSSSEVTIACTAKARSPHSISRCQP